MSTPASTAFTGFPPDGLAFLEGLARDNTKAYFDAHRATYETALLEPAKAFVAALGEELHARVSPAIRAEPRVNGSILRINRDTRFSADKTPYKDHLDIWLWEGEGPSRERPGYFVRLRPATVTVGVGMHRFERPLLDAFREAVGAERTGRELEDALARATALPGVAVGGGEAYKRVPRGFDADHPRADLLRHNALYVSGEWDLPAEASDASFAPWVAERLERMAPVARWLTKVLDTRA
ncbi:MAG TPA: DUF2461 domain-containing protein [Solirubrobacteraceae bacterium]|nr:DUF2461 domain-containing protein [Solirubrobacteraceae bacterium]